MGVSLADHGPHPHRNTRVRAVVRGKNATAGPYKAEAAALRDGDRFAANLAIPIADPKLWCPWDLGRPNLYVVEVSVIDAQGKLLDRSESSFGIREIRMERNPGYTTDEVMYPWTMLINGKRVFLRLANWGGPPDIFYGRNSDAKYRTPVELAREANINKLRIFGWHPTEVDHFYELCDELGITVGQDSLPLASVRLPEDEDFRRETYAEAVAVIRSVTGWIGRSFVDPHVATFGVPDDRETGNLATMGTLLPGLASRRFADRRILVRLGPSQETARRIGSNISPSRPGRE